MSAPPTSPLNIVLANSWVRAWHHADELPSTNDEALARLANLRDNQLPFLILADRQIAGRGRGANRWWSADGALTFSLILEPARWGLERALWPRLSVAVGGAVTEAAARWLPGRLVQLKWPNDVYVDGRKLCGILVETSPRSPDRLVIGIGVNVGNSFAGAPPDVAPRAISMIDIAKSSPSRFEVLGAILECLDADLHQLAYAPQVLIDRWRRCCYLTGKSVAVTDVERVMSGACLGLEDDGSLLIQTEAGPQRCFAGVVNVVE